MAMKIARVEPGSEAEVLGLGPGDELLSVDENELNDSLDYDFYTDSKSFHLKARVADGIREWDVQRTERGPFGCDFQTYLGDQKHSCSNHCMFCFIDQLENGVGMMRLYASEFLAELEKPHRIYGTKKMDVVTGEMASPLIHQMMAELHRQYPMVEVTVHTIKNKFFGGNVGVAGLVTATDIIAQCEGKLTSGTLGVPAVMLREEKDTFLDDITTDQLAQRLGVKVEVLPTSGGDEARALLRSGLHIARRRRA